MKNAEIKSIAYQCSGAYDLSTYIEKKQQQKKDGKEVNTDNPENLVNGTIDTNLGLFRAYMVMYLQRNVNVNNNFVCMVRMLEPTSYGLPLQVYCFSKNIHWVSFESIQSEIMEHFVSVLPYFELYPYQDVGSRDLVIRGLIQSNRVDLDDIIGMPWNTYHGNDTI